MTLQKTIFISDIHLAENEIKITQTFLKFLDELNQSVDAVYILGDLFAAWIGDDDATPFNQQIIAALKKASDKGILIYFLHGNRDFLIGKNFLQMAGCKALAEEEKISLYGTKVLLMHGDTLCTLDVSYQKMRALFQRKWIQKIFLSLPLFLRRRIADKLRAQSMGYKKGSYQNWMDVTHGAVTNVMNKHKVNYLIHGHTHRPAIHQVDDNKTRIVLGAWENSEAKILCWDETGNKELVDVKEYFQNLKTSS